MQQLPLSTTYSVPDDGFDAIPEMLLSLTPLIFDTDRILVYELSELAIEPAVALIKDTRRIIRL
jgi:hypothetical protein